MPRLERAFWHPVKDISLNMVIQEVKSKPNLPRHWRSCVSAWLPTPPLTTTRTAPRRELWECLPTTSTCALP